MSKALSIKVFSDGAVLETMLHDLNSGLVTGFTTNPSLMKKAGITSYTDNFLLLFLLLLRRFRLHHVKIDDQIFLWRFWWF